MGASGVGRELRAPGEWVHPLGGGQCRGMDPLDVLDEIERGHDQRQAAQTRILSAAGYAPMPRRIAVTTRLLGAAVIVALAVVCWWVFGWLGLLVLLLLVLVVH